MSKLLDLDVASKIERPAEEFFIYLQFFPLDISLTQLKLAQTYKTFTLQQKNWSKKNR